MAIKEAIWLSKGLSSLLAYTNPTPVCVLLDSQGSTSSGEDMSINAHSKYREICYRFVRESVRFKQGTLSYYPSDDQAADVLTKPLLCVLHEKKRNLLGIVI